MKITARNYYLVSALAHIIESDFKAVKTKFLDQGIDEEEIKTYFDGFKKLKDAQKIKDVEDKDISAWGKKPFKDFKKFVDTLNETKSKTEEKKLMKMEGAEKVAENDQWGVYRITTHEASCHYGAGTKWCVTEENSTHFEDYIKKNNFYYIISKTRDSKDPLYKIAMLVDGKGVKNYFDAEDKQISDIPSSIKEELPEFETEDGPQVDMFEHMPNEVSIEIEDIESYNLVRWFGEVGASTALSDKAQEALDGLLGLDNWEDLLRDHLDMEAVYEEPDTFIANFENDEDIAIEIYDGFEEDYDNADGTEISRAEQHIKEMVYEELSNNDYSIDRIDFEGANGDNADLTIMGIDWWISVDEDDLIALYEKHSKHPLGDTLEALQESINKLNYGFEIEIADKDDEGFVLTRKLGDKDPAPYAVLEELPERFRILEDPEVDKNNLKFYLPYENKNEDLEAYTNDIAKDLTKVFNTIKLSKFKG